MSKLPGAFNSEEHDEMSDFTALPADDYHVKVKDTSSKRNSKDTGDVYKFIFEVQEGKFKGRLLFSNLNLVHTNPTAVEIAEKELATMCRAAGLISIEDTEELEGCEFMVKATFKAATANYAEANEIKNYSSIEGIAQPSRGKKKTMSDEKPKPKKKVSFDE